VNPVLKSETRAFATFLMLWYTSLKKYIFTFLIIFYACQKSKKKRQKYQCRKKGRAKGCIHVGVLSQ
jgi:hypothetical protein